MSPVPPAPRNDPFAKLLTELILKRYVSPAGLATFHAAVRSVVVAVVKVSPVGGLPAFVLVLPIIK